MSNEGSWRERLSRLLQRGDVQGAEALCQAWQAAEPADAEPWLVSGGLWLRQRQFATARTAFEKAIELDASSLPACLQLAITWRAEGHFEQELAALKSALTIDPYDLLALLAKGDCLERLGRQQDALAAMRAACQVASQSDTEALGPDLQRMLRHAQARIAQSDQQLASALDQLLARELDGVEGLARDRFAMAVDLLLGRRKRFDSQPMGLYYPHLAPREFFPRDRFPWLKDLEAETDAIRREFLSVLASDSGFEPYMQYDTDQPLAQWRELNRNPAWSALHLIKDGQVVPRNADRCPRTMAVLARMPQPVQSGRTPVALFSCLKPGTRIPPHVGVSNVRLLVHLPLIVPAQCGFRVGSETRPWKPGEALIFDDTVEHEAWNLSDELRVVLIFDIWHPDLTNDEVALLGRLADIQNQLARTRSAS